MNFFNDAYEKKKYLYMDLVSMLFVILCHGCAEHNNENDTGVQDVVSNSTEVLNESD